jgi:PAS domain S-box-containing protein
MSLSEISPLEFVLQSAEIGTWDIELDSDKVHCSPEMLVLWGISPSEFHGKRADLQCKVHPDDVDKMKAAINEAIRSRSVYDMEYRIHPRAGETRWFRSRGRITFDNNKLPVRFSGVVFDITSKREKEEQLANVRKDTERFIMVAGHELKTPLTGLQLQLQVMEAELKEKFPRALEDPRVFGSISRQKEQIWRLVRIIDNICEHSQISSHEFSIQREDLDLVEFLSQLIQRFITLSTTNHNIHYSFHPKVQRLYGKWDRGRIEHAVLNLLSNALRFGHRGPISIAIDCVDNQAHISVRDSGPGISQEEQRKIFDAGYAYSNLSGMGLGLYITEQIVRSHGGRIVVNSCAGEGSEFTIVLPWNR